METATPSSSKSLWIKIAAALVIAAIGVVGFLSFSSRTTAPEVSFLTLKGETVNSKSLQGKVVMVNFWATSCTTCVAEMPHMVQTYNKYKDRGLEFVAVAMSYDPPSYVVNYAQTRGLPFKVTMDTEGKLAQAFGEVKMTPTTYLIDKQGRIIKRYLGEPDWDALHKLLESELAA
jgi:peroxiredoxin